MPALFRQGTSPVDGPNSRSSSPQNHYPFITANTQVAKLKSTIQIARRPQTRRAKYRIVSGRSSDSSRSNLKAFSSRNKTMALRKKEIRLAIYIARKLQRPDRPGFAPVFPVRAATKNATAPPLSVKMLSESSRICKPPRRRVSPRLVGQYHLAS